MHELHMGLFLLPFFRDVSTPGIVGDINPREQPLKTYVGNQCEEL